ncbi:MAG: CDP-alcohol phosphatidyltransferase family protein [Methylotetracoccus sp.]
MTASSPLEHRRPISSRETGWAKHTARWLKGRGIKPNTVSVWSAIFGLFAGIAFFYGYLLPAALCMQLRLLCNLFDGMIAVEGGMTTKSGEIFNDSPDRFSDLFIFVGAGYGIHSVAWGSDLGWLAAVLAVLTAYVRVLGVSSGTKSYFSGPMAKQHRMAVLTVSALLAILERHVLGSDWVLVVALAVIAVGSLLTVVRRFRLVVNELESR